MLNLVETALQQLLIQVHSGCNLREEQVLKSLVLVVWVT